MHNLNSYVRDFYFFRRNFYPQLSLVHMNPDEASYTLQKQVLLNLRYVIVISYSANRQTSDISCTLLGNKIVDHSDGVGASPVGAAPTTSIFST